MSPVTSSFVSVLQWVQDTELSTAFRESNYVWGVVDGVHVLGLCIFLGMLLFWELRLFNVGLRSATVAETWARLSPWLLVGFVIMTASGVTLFVGEPVRYWGSIFFRIKAVALVLAGLNALVFHLRIGRNLERFDTLPLPRSAHVIGVVSVTLWVLIVFCGRLIAYNWFPPLV
jgi:hypothetical protein